MLPLEQFLLFQDGSSSPEVNGPILSKLFQVGGNQEIWQSCIWGGEFKLIRSHVKSDVRTISEGFYVFCPCLLLKMENVKFFSLQVYCMS